jgi:hypothetical protein
MKKIKATKRKKKTKKVRYKLHHKNQNLYHIVNITLELFNLLIRQGRKLEIRPTSIIKNQKRPGGKSHRARRIVSMRK